MPTPDYSQDYTITDMGNGIRVEFKELENAQYARAALVLKGIDPARLWLTDRRSTRDANKDSLVLVRGMKLDEFAPIYAEGKRALSGLRGFTKAQAMPMDDAPQLRYSERAGKVQVTLHFGDNKTGSSHIANKLNEYGLPAIAQSIDHTDRHQVTTKKRIVDIQAEVGNDLLVRIDDLLTTEAQIQVAGDTEPAVTAMELRMREKKSASDEHRRRLERNGGQGGGIGGPG